MLKQKYKSFLENGVFKNQVWMVIAGAVIVSNVLLSIKIYKMETAEKTIIHPISLLQTYSVEGEQVDPNYVASMAEEFLRARFLYTPKTVATQFDNVAKHFHPSIYGDKKSELDAAAARIIRNDETSVFFPMSTHVKQLKAYVQCEVTGYLGKKPVTQKLQTFEIEFRYSGGRIWLYNWLEVAPDSSGKNYVPVANDQEYSVETLGSEEKQ